MPSLGRLIISVREYDRRCKHGFTRDELRELIRDIDHFDHWMRGQTMMLCSGQKYNHDTREYEPDCEEAHGGIVYVWDVEQYLSGREPLD